MNDSKPSSAKPARPWFELKRNDASGAAKLFRELASAGPVPPEAISVMAKLQDKPSKFFEAIAGVPYSLERIGERSLPDP